MKPSRRSGFTVLGTLLIYGAFLLQSRAGYLEPAPSVPLFQPVLGSLLGAFLVYVVGWLLSQERSALVVSVVSVIFFLFNPLLVEPRFLLEPWMSMRGPLLTLGLAALWLSVRNWSIFMRSLMLMQGFGVMFLFGPSASLFWIAGLAVWSLFDRRRASAFWAFLLIVTGGWVLAEIARVVHSIIFTHEGSIKDVVYEFYARYTQGIGWPVWTSSAFVREQAAQASQLLSLPWILLAFQTFLVRLLRMVEEKRSDATSWLAMVGVLAGLSGFISPSDASCEIQRWLLFSACASPLAAQALSQREFLKSRPARVTALAGFFFSAAAVWIGHPWTMPAGLALAFLFSWWRVTAPWMSLGMRWTAVLGGATIGAWLAEGFILFRS